MSEVQRQTAGSSFHYSHLYAFADGELAVLVFIYRYLPTDTWPTPLEVSVGQHDHTTLQWQCHYQWSLTSRYRVPQYTLRGTQLSGAGRMG